MKVMERIGVHTGHFNVEASPFADLQGSRKLKYVERNFMLKKRVTIMSITRIIGKGCIKYTFCTIYFWLYIFILSCAFCQKISPVDRDLFFM